MEKKTIGKFISALRRANGMTQKELAELLYVSDKTVSRWECDECTPDLSLIPAIADIFGVTADELLRGERRSREAVESDDDDSSKNLRAFSNKVFKNSLRRRKTAYENLTWISFGILFCGLITAMICNLFFSGALGFFLSAIFIAAAVICQVCFLKNTLFPTDDDDERLEDYRKYNTSVTHRAIALYIAAAVMLSALLPMAVITDAYTGVDFSAWILLTLICGGIALIVAYFIYIFAIKPRLLRSARLIYTEKAVELHKKERKLLLKTTAVALILGAVLFVGAAVVESIDAVIFAKGYTFDNYEDFKAFMEEVATDPRYYLNDYYSAPGTSFEVGYWNEDGEFINIEAGETDYPVRTITDSAGNVLCEYIHPYCVSRIDFNEDGKLPVDVWLQDDMRQAYSIQRLIVTMLFVSIAAETVICGVVYIVKLRRLKKEN